jgi:outer membrane protein assembly factor BamD (BamD/ComL family)
VIIAAKSIAKLVLLASVATAPFQCASKAGPEQRLEEEPAEVLYELAEKFKVEGNSKARARTLRYLLERFPSSRFAETAKQDLAGMPGE